MHLGYDTSATEFTAESATRRPNITGWTQSRAQNDHQPCAPTSPGATTAPRPVGDGSQGVVPWAIEAPQWPRLTTSVGHHGQLLISDPRTPIVLQWHRRGRTREEAMTQPSLSAYERLPVVGLHSIAHLLPIGKGRCGIYVLTFRNGDRYVGQAVDVAARFGAHRATYPGDIVEVAFRRVLRADLDAVERAEIIRLHGAGVPLRNISIVPSSAGASPFDVLVTPDEQQSWLTSTRVATADPADRPEQPEQRHRLSQRFHRLSVDAHFAALEPVLRRYIAWTIPYPARTELSYWALSALPATNRSVWPRLFTVSIQQMETLFACFPKGAANDLQIVLNVDAATLRRAWGHLGAFAARKADFDLDLDDRYHRSGVVGLRIYSPQAAARVLAMRGVAAAARQLNLDLMRKRATIHWRTHCFDLADVAYTETHISSARSTTTAAVAV